MSGGEVTLAGANLTAESGRVELGSIGEAGLVTLNSTSSGWNLDYSNIQNFQDIQLSQAASVDVSGNDAGAIQLQGRRIGLSEGASLLAVTQGNGGGEITLQASESIQMTGMSSFAPPPFSSLMPTSAYVEIAPGANGDGSSLLTLETNRLELSGGAQIGLSMAGTGSSGSVNVQAETVMADGISDTTSFSGLFAAVLPAFPAPGQGGELIIEADRLQLINGAQILATTFGGGDAGNLIVRAQDVEVIGFSDQGPSLLASTSEVPQIPPLPSGSGSGGSINIQTERLLVADGGQISTGTNSRNPAGDLTVNATESIELRGTGTRGRSGLFASARVGDGSGGDINVDTDQLIVRDEATINVSNFSSLTPGPPPGTGPAGNLNVNAETILLDNQALLTAETVDGDRANITLQADGIVLRRGSQITTNATGTATGGNITLDTGVLVAFENSDITANSVNSFGGQVIVNALSVFGTEFRQQLTPESDITASSELGSQFSGEVVLDTPDVDPSQGLVALPGEVVDATNQVAQSCRQMEDVTGEFTITGRGGLPPNPTEVLSENTVLVDFGPPNLVSRNPSGLTRDQEISTQAAFVEARSLDAAPDAIVEAQGWMMNADGRVKLVAAAPESTPQSSWRRAAECNDY